MTPDAFFQPKIGQSLLIPGQNENVRGQCVQSVGLWVQALGLNFPSHTYAYQYYEAGIPGYTKIPAGGPIRTGDIVIWGPNFPDSPNAGHIDVAAGDGTLQGFMGWDSNWSPPLKLNKINHVGGNQYIIGYLRREGEDMLNYDQVDSMAHAYLNDSIANNPGLKEYVGKSAGEVIAAFNGAPERAAYLKQIDDWEKAATAQYEEVTDKLYRRK